MALWVWRFVEGEPPHFFRAPQYLSTESILYIYEVWVRLSENLLGY